MMLKNTGITEASTWRIELAKNIAPAYSINPNVEAVFIFGSVARGFADRYSDIELGVIWSQAPDRNQLQKAAQLAYATDWEILPFNEAKQSWSDEYNVQGMRIEVAHWRHETIDNIITDVVEKYDVSQNRLMFEKQATVSTLQNAVALHGEKIIKEWQKKVAEYPEGLAVAMVEKHLNFAPFGSREMLAARNEIPLLYENHCHSIRMLINLLFGLNRIYYPTFKWTSYFIEQMSIVPPDFFVRVEKVFQSETVKGTQELRMLIEETFDLVDKYLPQIDLTQQRKKFAQPYPLWD